VKKWKYGRLDEIFEGGEASQNHIHLKNSMQRGRKLRDMKENV